MLDRFRAVAERLFDHSGVIIDSRVACAEPQGFVNRPFSLP